MSALIEIQERDEEFYRAYKRALLLPGMDDQKAIRAAIHSETSRYWVSPMYVYRDILGRIRGFSAKTDPAARRKNPRKCKKRMYDALYRIYCDLQQKPCFRDCSTYFIVCFVVNHTAPRFYIDFRRARAIVSRMRKQKQNDRINNHRKIC